MSSRFSRITDELTRVGFCVTPDFLKPSEVSTIRGEMSEFEEAGEFHPAKIGIHNSNAEVRRDKSRWFDMAAGTSAQKMITAPLELLRLRCNEELLLGLVSLEGHYSLYEDGDFYRRHHDALSSDDRRVLSVVLYLNEAQLPAHGGQLLLHTATPTRIEALGGTLVVFMSSEVEHEVLESRRQRKSFAGWFAQRKFQS